MANPGPCSASDENGDPSSDKEPTAERDEDEQEDGSPGEQRQFRDAQAFASISCVGRILAVSCSQPLLPFAVALAPVVTDGSLVNTVWVHTGVDVWRLVG